MGQRRVRALHLYYCSSIHRKLETLFTLQTSGKTEIYGRAENETRQKRNVANVERTNKDISAKIFNLLILFAVSTVAVDKSFPYLIHWHAAVNLRCDAFLKGKNRKQNFLSTFRCFICNDNRFDDHKSPSVAFDVEPKVNKFRFSKINEEKNSAFWVETSISINCE